jgi:hypothetical protein
MTRTKIPPTLTSLLRVVNTRRALTLANFRDVVAVCPSLFQLESVDATPMTVACLSDAAMDPSTLGGCLVVAVAVVVVSSVCCVHSRLPVVQL